MLSLIGILLVVWFVVTVVLTGWTLLFQGSFYTEPVDDIVWRGPVAGTVVTLVLALWTFLDYRSPGHYRSLFEPSAAADPRPFDELTIVTSDNKKQTYKLARGKGQYQRDGQPMPSRPSKIFVKEDGEEVAFEPDRDASGNFKTINDVLHYRDAKGRVMVEGYLGQLSTGNVGMTFVLVFLNLLHLAAWFLVMWLLLDYRWPHALLTAAVFWGVVTLFVMPQVLSLAERMAKG